MPLAGAVFAGATGNLAAAVFALFAFLLWPLLYWLLRAIAENDPSVVRQLRWAPALALALWAAALFSIARDPTSAKFIYSSMTLACLIGGLDWAIPHWAARTSAWRQTIPQIAAYAAIVVWLLYGESDWYVTPVTAMGIPHTHPYLVALPSWWWVACMALPAASLAWLASWRQQAQQQQRALLNHHTCRALFVAGVLLLLLMAFLQAWDFIRPRLDLQIIEGDEFGYLVSAYQLLERGEFNPPHMPLISLYLALILAAAGDSTTAILITNAAVLMLTVVLLLYALWLISADMRMVLLGGLLIVSLRTLYLNVWTPLTETLNNMLWAAAILGLLAAVRRPTFATHLGLGTVISLLLLTRSQNLGGIIGLGVVYLGLVVFIRTNWTAVPARQSLMLVLALLAAVSLPLFAWGEFRQATTGRFQVMDGRGAEILLGMNMPGVRDGFGENVWEPNVASWKAQHPNASSGAMVLAVIRYRLERPAETAVYAWYRTLELFNFRFPLLAMNSSYWVAFKANLQLTIGVVASGLLLFTPIRWLGIVIWTIFIPFAGIFIAIYVEPRYRIPMDPLLTIGAGILLGQILLKARTLRPVRKLLPVSRSSPVRLFVLLLAASMFTIAGMRLIDANSFVGERSKFVGAELRPEGATLVAKPAFDIAAYPDLPTWGDLLKTDDLSSIEGKLFRARFSLVGHIFRAGNLDRYARLGLQYEELQRIEPTDSESRKHLASNRMSASFKAALMEEGIKQRGVIELVGRVRTMELFHDLDARDFIYVIIDALYVNCSDEPLRQQCKR